MQLPFPQLCCSPPAPRRADDLSELRERLEAQEQKIRVLERKLELQDEATKAAVPNTPVVRASPQQGFRIQSADAANVLRVRGVLHFDGRYFSDDITPATADTWIFRRVRPTLEGTLNGIYDFRFTPDFAGGRTFILDAFVAARLKPWAVVTAGKFKVPVGLERLRVGNRPALHRARVSDQPGAESRPRLAARRRHRRRAS